MYYAIVGALMFVLPVLSIAIDASHHVQTLMYLVGKWFVFWGVGIRLITAGVRQIAQPAYTAQTIFGIERGAGDKALALVRELGFANLAIGAAAAVTLVRPGWLTAGALSGGIFLGLAGISHALRRPRTRLQDVAMVSDLFVAAMLTAHCAWIVLRW